VTTPRSTAAVGVQEEERVAPPFPPLVVEDMLKVLDKAVRAHQLYMHNNPSYLKALENARRGFEPIWAQADDLVLQVTDTQFRWCGVVVHDHPEKAGDSLPWLLFKDGLRELALFPGFEHEELERFLAIIPRVRRAAPQEDDLLTILWEQDFAHLRYRYVEANDPTAPLDVNAEPGRWPAAAGQSYEPPSMAIDEARREQEQSHAAGDAAVEERPQGMVRMEDFDSTVYFLDPGEIDYLRKETEREYAVDLRRLVVSALLDIFELQVDPLVREEVAGDLEALVLHLLTAGQFSTVAFLLRELEGTMQRSRELRPVDVERLGRLPERLSHPDALGQMLQALEEASSLPPKDELAQLFAQLNPGALAALLDAIDRTQNAELRPLLEASAERLAQSNTSELVKLVKHGKASVAREAIRRAGAMRTAAAVPALAEVMQSGAERPMRAAVVTALTDIGTPGALAAIELALNDPERDIRLAAIRALSARTYRPALARVEAAVKGKPAREADRTERIALFELYGQICGDAGVPVLDGILNAKGGLFGRKEDPELRACAAIALGKVNSVAARASLERSSGEKDIIVRNAVSRALRGGAAS
jgi:hypothetical protein